MSEKCQKVDISKIPAQGLELYVKVQGVPAGVPGPAAGPGCHVTAGKKWSKEVNIVVM